MSLLQKDNESSSSSSGTQINVEIPYKAARFLGGYDQKYSSSDIFHYLEESRSLFERNRQQRFYANQPHLRFARGAS